MRDGKLVEAMAILERMQSYDLEGKDPLAASALRQWAGEVRAALAALRSAAPMRECRHCGWLCAPNNEQSKSWYPLAAPQPEEAL